MVFEKNVRWLAFVLLAVVLLQGCEDERPMDQLGLTAADRRNDSVDSEVLRKKAEAVADDYLLTQAEELKEFSGGPYTLAVDYSLVPLIAGQGYRSCFYYFCWDLKLPYRLKTQGGDSHILVVQVSDRTPGNQHDIEKFRVLRMFTIDDVGQVTKWFEDNRKE